jgi:hypothetical protein
MRLTILIVLVSVLSATTLKPDTLGFVEQRFSDLHFERGKWERKTNLQLPCFTYTALEEGAKVDVLRFGMNNLVPFKATKGLKVTVCGSTAAFDEGFETGTPVSGRIERSPNP